MTGIFLLGMSVVMNALSKYLKIRGIKQADFAAEIELSQATVSRLAAGTLKPSLSVAIRIERKTDSMVPANSWCEDEGAEKGAAQ